MKSIVLLLLALSVTLTGCASDPSTPVNLFAGERADKDVAVLLPVPQNTASVILRVDGEAPGSCLVNCMFYRPVRILPGNRTLSVQAFFPPGVSLYSGLPLMPPERVKDAVPLITDKASLLVNSSKAEIQVVFEPGKKYQLVLGTRTEDKGVPYAWWQVVPAGR